MFMLRIGQAAVYMTSHGQVSFTHPFLSQVLTTSSVKSIERLITQSKDPSLFDPFVANEIDVSSDMFRIQLVIELLNTCGPYFLKGKFRIQLQKFFLYFQRYLFSKTSIPLHVEFAFLDCIDYLDSHVKKDGKKGTLASTSESSIFNRYDSLEEVVRLIEEHEAKDKVLLSTQDDEDSDREDNENDNEIEKEDEDNVNNVNEQYVSDAEEEDDSMSELEIARLMEKKQAEVDDEEFNKAFKSMMMESLESASSRNMGSSKSDVDRMAIPAVLPKPKNSLNDAEEINQPKKGVLFKVLGRDGKGRVETRQLLLPQEVSFISKIQQHEEASRLEKQKMKERIIQLNQSNMMEEFESSEGTNAVKPNRKATNRAFDGYNQAFIAPTETVDYSSKKDGDTLNLEQFLRESTASEIRKMHTPSSTSSSVPANRNRTSRHR